MTTPKTRPTIVLGESHSYPVLPLRDIVVFPHMIVPLFVGREKSIRALEEVMKNDALILLATQKNASDDDPSPDSIYEVGTLASVLQLLKLPDGTVKVLVEGLERARVQKYSDRSEYYEATAIALADTDAPQFRKVLDVNLGGYFLTLRAAARAMGRAPTADAYEQFARASKGALPSQATVRHRLGVYARQTAPLLDWYRGRGLLVSVPGEGPIETIRGAIRGAAAGARA